MDKTQLILGRGEVYFEEWIPGTRSGDGERYIGNTPSMQIEKRIEYAESRQSVSGVAVRTFRTPVKEDISVSFTTDNMDISNLSAWLGGEVSVGTEAPSAPAAETFTLRTGRFYQLGTDAAPYTGARNLFALTVKVNGVFVQGLIVDEANGRFSVPSDRVDLDGATATVSYEISGSTGESTLSASKILRGSLRYLSRNAFGRNRNYYFPHVLLSSRDQLQLKGDEWQTVTFDVDVLAPMSVYESGISGVALGKESILDNGMSLEEFALYEDILNTITNSTIPSRGY